MRQKKAFLERFRVLGNITSVCIEIGCARARVYEWLKADPSFAESFQEADAEATEVLEAEARRRAVEGVQQEHATFYRGQEVGRETVTEYSDTLLIFLLKARAPAKYRETFRSEHTGPGGGPIEYHHTMDLSKLSEEERDQLESLVRRSTLDA